MLDFLRRKKSLIDSGLLMGAVDNHSHILWGVDDGVRTCEESLATLAWLEEVGVETLWLTPHTMETCANTTEGLKARFVELQQAYDGPIQLHLASEYMMDGLFREHLETGDFLTHSDNRVLVETSIWGAPLGFWDLLEEMIDKGFKPIIAHPERYLYMNMSDYQRLYGMGVLLQLNLPSIIGSYGESVKQRAEQILHKRWYDMVGSDTHRLRSIHKQHNEKVLSKDLFSELAPLMKR